MLEEVERLIETGRERARRVADYNDHLLSSYHHPRSMGAAAALQREATWMRLAMRQAIDGHTTAPNSMMTIVDAQLVTRDASFHLRLRPTLYDYVVHGRGVLFINLGAGKNVALLQEWGLECVPCGTEGCDGVTTPVSGKELSISTAAPTVYIGSNGWSCAGTAVKRKCAKCK